MSKIGCDILRISRIVNKINDKGFMERIFSQNEISIFEERNYNPETITGNFCAKEAYVKALGTGFGTIKPYQVEILRKPNGQPYGICNGNEFSVSISHDGEYAIAFVIID